MERTCKYCDSKYFTVEDSGKHIKLLCADCGKYQQFVSQGEPDNGDPASEAQRSFVKDLMRKAESMQLTSAQAGAIIKALKV